MAQTQPHHKSDPILVRSNPTKGAAARQVKTGEVSQLWQRLRAARRKADLRQQDIAEKIGKSRATIALWESHQEDIRTSPSAEDVRVFAQVCKVPVTFLMDNRYHPDDVWKMDGDGMSANDHAAPVAPPASAALASKGVLLGMEDRRAQTFWSSVEFTVCERSPGLAESFVRHPQLPDFMHNANAVVFASDSVVAQNLMVGAMALLLQAEHRDGKTYAKHVLVFRGTGSNPINESQCEKLWGVSVRLVDNVKDASKYLQAL